MESPAVIKVQAGDSRKIVNTDWGEINWRQMEKKLY